MVVKYSVRIELYNATSEHYLILDNEMHAQDCIRKVIQEQPVRKNEYTIVSDLTIEDLRDLVKKCASATNKEFTILITEVIGGKALYFIPPASGT